VQRRRQDRFDEAANAGHERIFAVDKLLPEIGGVELPDRVLSATAVLGRAPMGRKVVERVRRDRHTTLAADNEIVHADRDVDPWPHPHGLGS
jgi:hypothetical protein